MYHGVIVYNIFVALMVFAVLNVITAIFVENATKIALRNHEIIIYDMLDNRDQFRRDALRFFNDADEDQSGTLNFEEFERHLAGDSAQAFLQASNLHTLSARRLFRLLDTDNDGMVSAKDFVVACMGLRGTATTANIAALQLEVRRLSSQMSACSAHMGRRPASPAEPHGRLSQTIASL